AIRHRRIEGKMKNCTVSKTKTGKYFVSIQCEIEAAEPTPPTEAVGIDLGIKTFAVLSDGHPIESPKHLRKAERLLKIRQRRLSRKVKGSNGRAKARHVVATIHARVANQRKDFHHKESRKIVNRFGTIGLETLNVAGMVKNHSLAKSISDAGWSQFVQFLTYKTAWAGGEIVKHDRWFASSKLCHVCGEKNIELVLGDRTWNCAGCGTAHDRDQNAAMNLKPVLSIAEVPSTAGAAGSNAGGYMSSAVRHSAPEKFKTLALEAQVL
ncbi:MAG: transposase, partial [Anderseniella sp.]